jgi:hypothetical protein
MEARRVVIHPSIEGGTGVAAREPSVDDEQLRDTSRRLERLLQEIQGMAGPSTWTRIEELLRGILELHASGFRRLLALAAQNDGSTSFEDRLVADDLVSSLLLLHGLHPLSSSERIESALETMAPYLASQPASVELVGIGDDGAVRLRLVGALSNAPPSVIEHALRRAVQEAAPEVTRVEIEMPEGVRRENGLVELKLKKPEDRA